ncbi:MAG TPA: hypothetical protein VMA35_09915 [Candidatus Sulfopaludibacter sp.]|nr:hypothetical protein [Candidatus Sulfopaludibacter sp.]
MATAVAVVAQQTNLPPGLDFSSFKIIADRDIFNQSRLPHERAARAVRVADSFSLVGTLFYAGGDIAFFDGTSDEYRQALKVGGQIAGFKVTAVTLDSVTLSDGTNETNLKITAQMRRDDSGRWSLSAERASYAGTGSATSLAAGAYSGRSRRYGSSRNNFPMMTGSQAGNEEVDDSSASGAGAPPPPAMEDTSAAAPAGGADDALARLMQRRAQEEQQLRQGQ